MSTNLPDTIFLHIPKTGGTSLRNNLINSNENLAIYPTNKHLIDNGGGYLSFNQIVEDSQLLNLSKDHVLFGHFNLLKIKNIENYKPKIYTVIREPFQRTISHLIHIKTHNPTFKESSFKEIIEERINNLANLQAKVLGYDPKRKNVKQLIHQLDDFEFIGITNQMTEFQRILQEKEGWSFAINNKENVSKYSKEFVLSEIGLKYIQRIQNNLRIDYVLYHIVSNCKFPKH